MPGYRLKWVGFGDNYGGDNIVLNGLWNRRLGWRPWGKDNPTSIILSANNIFDVDARRHASFTKDFVPLAGRNLKASVRVSF